MSLSDQDKEKFIEWVKLNVDETMVPEDPGNGGALVFNMVHAIRGDNERYSGESSQDDDIAQWMLSKNQYF